MSISNRKIRFKNFIYKISNLNTHNADTAIKLTKNGSLGDTLLPSFLKSELKELFPKTWLDRY